MMMKWCLSDEEPPPPTKQNNPSKPTKKSYVWEKKSFQNIDKSFSELQAAPPPKEKNATPYEYFCELIDSDMIENICTQTNLYHLQKTGKEGVFTTGLSVRDGRSPAPAPTPT